MASFILSDVNRFPQGQSVAVYPVTNWPTGVVDQNAAPLGSATNTQTMGASNLTFTGLSEGVQYVAYASVAGQHRYTFLRIPSAADAPIAAQPVGQSGTLANRPTAVPGNANVNYFATDDNGGTLYRSDGSTWTALGPGVSVTGGTIIASAAKTADATSTTVYPTRTDVTGLSVTDSVGGRSVIIEAGGPRLLHSVSGGSAIASIMEGATELQFFRFDTAAASQRTGWYASTDVIAQTAASHTYKVSLSVITAGTATLGGASGSASWVRIRGA